MMSPHWITSEVPSRGFNVSSMSVWFHVRHFLHIQAKGCTAVRKRWSYIMYITYILNICSFQQYSAQSRSNSWLLEFEKKDTSADGVRNTKSRREWRDGQPIFSSRTKTTALRKREADRRIKHINGKTSGKKDLFYNLDFFGDFFPPFVSSVNLFVRLLCIISPLSSPCTPLLCSPPLSSPLPSCSLLFCPPLLSSSISPFVSYSGRHFFDPRIPRLTPLSPILSGSY